MKNEETGEELGSAQHLGERRSDSVKESGEAEVIYSREQ